MDKKKITLVYTVAALMIIGLLGYTYSYFSATVTEENKTETVIKTKGLSLTFEGTSEINTSDMIPGDSFTKTFTVENTSTVKTFYNIYMENITNEFNEDLVYTLTDEDGEIVSETPLPVTNTGKSYLIENIEIEPSEIKEYTLKIEYKYLDTPQNDYQGAEFKATVGIDSNKVESVTSGIECVAPKCTDNDSNGIVSIGDLITYDSESFYVYSINDTTVKMLAQYNLYVGGEISGQTNQYTEYGNEATGLQDSNMLAYYEDSSAPHERIYKGVTVFSSEDINGENLNSYEGSIVESYVSAYNEKLTEKNVSLEDITLITKEELIKLGCEDGGSCTNAPEFVYSTSYWTKSSVEGDMNHIYAVANNSFSPHYEQRQNTQLGTDGSFGVRPVIEVAIENL